MTPQQVIEQFRHWLDLDDISEFNRNRMTDLLDKFGKEKKIIKVVHKPGKTIYVDKLMNVDKIMTLDEIMDFVCEKTGLTADQIKRSSDKSKYNALGRRHVAYTYGIFLFSKIARQWPYKYSYLAIAKYLGYTGKQAHANIIYYLKEYKLPKNVELVDVEKIVKVA